MIFVFRSNKSRPSPRLRTASFTLVELLIVIGILAILTAAVVIVLNPAELLKQSRDSTRMSDLASLDNAIRTLQTQADISLGTAATVYISLPDTSSTCGNLGLPTLPSGYTYHCVATTTLQAINGSGWLPIDFTLSNIQSLSALPLDPTNTTSTGLYYTYIPGGSFELTANMESEKQQSAIQKNDGGNSILSYETGSNLALTPLIVEERSTIITIPKDFLFWIAADTGIIKNESNAISQWNNLGSYGSSITQANSSYQPTYIPNEKNGNPVVRFTGDPAQYIGNTSVSSNTPYTLFLVFKIQSFGTGHQTYFGSNAGMMSIWHSGGSSQKNIGFGNMYDQSHSAMHTIDDYDTWKIIAVTLASDKTGIIYENSVYKGTGTLYFNNLSGVTLGARYDQNYPAKEDVGEVLIYPRILSADEITSVNNYLNEKWNIY